MTLISNIKKRDVLAVLLGLLFLQFIVQQTFGVFRSPEESWSIGTLYFPSNGEVKQAFTMPVSGSFRVALRSVKDGSFMPIAGTKFDQSVCINAEKKPSIDKRKYGLESSEMKEYYSVLSAYFSRQLKCFLDSKFGVIEIELLNMDDGSMDSRLSSNMYKVYANSNVGTVIADFRPIKKGVELQLTVRTSLHESHVDRERIPYEVMIHPIKLD